MDLSGYVEFLSAVLRSLCRGSFAENNTDSPPGTIDLHGLYVKEGTSRLSTYSNKFG